ncbi:PAS domain-containing protein [Haloplanus sp. GCM10025708]|uniref:PAS domain-containing protein n=1 Tax=Haloferacaceae TaxID=1644056 RepID=UPI003615F27D
MYLSTADTIRILHVDDDPGVAEMTATFLERADDRFDVETATSASEGLDRLVEGGFDCVVSDYDMPDCNGLDFLEDVRENCLTTPFILFTGKGSEEIASEAISMGVSDYLQKSPGSEQYELLANRIRTLVERARARRELEQRESHLRQAQMIADIGSWYMDVPAEEIYWSDEIYDIFDAERDERQLDPERFIRYVHPDDRAFVSEQWHAALDGEEYDIEHRIVTGGGETRWVRERAVIEFGEDGTATDAVGVVQDVTDRKEREQQLEALFDNAPVAMVYIEFDGGEPIVEDVNAAFERVFGYAGREAIGRNLDDLVVPDDRRSEAADVNDRIRTGEPIETSVRRETANGLRDFLLYVVPLSPDESGTERYVIYNDVTDRKAYERRLERQNDQLDEFASIVSHDLRNPLGVAEGYLELARSECDSDHLDGVESALSRSQALVDELLALARDDVRSDGMEPVALDDLAETCWQGLTTADATLSVATDRAVRADHGHLRQLVENLLENAVVHGGAGVTVSVGHLDDGFYVADDGSGIPTDARERAFESGYSTADDGTGYGLSVVARVAEAHGWDVTVTDSDDGGARFEITGVDFVDS